MVTTCLLFVLAVSCASAGVLHFQPSELITCPDRSKCATGSTCCRLKDGAYGCCPFRNATCCSDNIHCCPEGTKCDLAMQSCQQGDRTVPWLKKLPARVSEIGVNVCPDRSVCNANETCCKLQTGNYGCCPLPNAVCCSDGLHCCPQGYECNEQVMSCERALQSVPWSKKLPARSANATITCPDQSHCLSFKTCCLLATGKYACCPFSNAVCCSDHLHCCPNGYTCDVKTSQCIKESGTKEERWEALSLFKSAAGVTCPDGSQCPTGETCCPIGGGTYGCCPEPEAVCCSDDVHCCPHGYTCNESTGSCVKQSQVGLESRSMATLVKTGGIICPDGSQCGQQQTCCSVGRGSYGCCPEPEAVCCADNRHCCPHGYTCDVASSLCRMKSSSGQLKTVAVSKIVINAVCPDGSYCPSSNTCCLIRNGTYSCCRLPQAVCCSDRVHCCPQGYVCGLTKCEKRQSVKMSSLAARKICPDYSVCKGTQTCCALKSGRYGCCPVHQAVCCQDRIHCCPQFHKCSPGRRGCVPNPSPFTQIGRAAKKIERKMSTTYVCPDRKFECSNLTTCCKQADGQYGCCPYKNANCCPDLHHCCPSNHKCQKDGTCKNSQTSQKSASFAIEPAHSTADNLCPGSESECPSFQTCCPMTTGAYGCCPLPDAVCCQDGKHCCPSGNKCDPMRKSCHLSSTGAVLDFLTKIKARRLP